MDGKAHAQLAEVIFGLVAQLPHPAGLAPDGVVIVDRAANGSNRNESSSLAKPRNPQPVQLAPLMNDCHRLDERGRGFASRARSSTTSLAASQPPITTNAIRAPASRPRGSKDRKRRRFLFTACCFGAYASTTANLTTVRTAAPSRRSKERL